MCSNKKRQNNFPIMTQEINGIIRSHSSPYLSFTAMGHFMAKEVSNEAGPACVTKSA